MSKQEISECLDEYFFKQLAARPLPPYHVMTWSRDCDMCESTRVRICQSYISLTQSYASYIEGREWAEGPSSWKIIDPTPEVDSIRDRAMEAFENGRGTSIYV